MDIVKTRIEGNETVVIIPKSFNVKPGTEYRLTKGKDGVLTLIPVKKVPSSIEDLFKNWHSE